nr:hypothetical protein GCM10020093_012820 [Planobispora longispora]
MLGLPGAAYLYQGQELGLPEVDVAPEDRRDPAWPRSGVSRDGCRVPLPWRRDPVGAHGFSPPGARPPWLPVPRGGAGCRPRRRRAIRPRRCGCAAPPSGYGGGCTPRAS